MKERPICEAYTCRQSGKQERCYIGPRAYRTCIHKDIPRPLPSPLDHFPTIVEEGVATEELVQRVRDIFAVPDNNLEGIDGDGI